MEEKAHEMKVFISLDYRQWLQKEKKQRNYRKKDDLCRFRIKSEQILANDRVCGRHFVSGKAAKSWDRLNIDCVPALNHEKRVDRKNLEQRLQRGQRTNEKLKKGK